MVLEEALESPLDCKEIQPVHPKGNQSWIFIGRTDAEAEILILWPPDAKNWLIRKDLDTGKDWRREEKGTTEDQMVGWHHWLDGHEFEQAPGVGDGQGSLVGCSSWVRRVRRDWATELPDWDQLWIKRYYIQVCIYVLNHIWLFLTPYTVSHQASLKIPWNFPGKKTGVGRHFLLKGSSCPRDPNCILSPALAGRFFTTVSTEKPSKYKAF